MSWLKRLKGRLRFKEPLSRHTTLRVGGPADVWLEPADFRELQTVVCRSSAEGIPSIVVGGGSNILFSDAGFRGIAIRLNSCQFTKIEAQGNQVCLGAGLGLNRLLPKMRSLGLGGLEFLAGIPATLGGALVMNAGGSSSAKGIGSLVENVTVLDKGGRIKRLSQDKRELHFGYRQSNLNRYIVLQAQLRLTRRHPQAIKAEMRRFLEKKRATQDLGSKSAGCIFNNPAHPLTAAELIAACGLKNRRRGGARICGRHANYIINHNGAKAQDILDLIKLVQTEVSKRFGLHLEPEIRIVR